MQFTGLAGWEWIIIVGIVVLVFFGVKRIPEIARTLGKTSTEYQKARLQAKKELQFLKGQEVIDRKKLESIADSLGIDCTGKNDMEIKTAIELELNKVNQ
jgi:sec-independent protein translocase protein TatA